MKQRTTFDRSCTSLDSDRYPAVIMKHCLHNRYCRCILKGLHSCKVCCNLVLMQFGLQHLLLTTVYYVLVAASVLTGLQTADYRKSRAVGSLCTDRAEDCRLRKMLLFVVVQQLLVVLLKFIRVLHLCGMAHGVLLINREQVGCRASLCSMFG